MALAVQRGLRICNPMAKADKIYGASLDVCSYLVESLVLREKLDQVRHMTQVTKAQKSARQVRSLHEGIILERRG